MGEERRVTSKVYCEKCDTLFGSRREYDRHSERHSAGMACESCPIDTLVSKIARLFKGNA
jgi:uncharacterized C2H2 Zn-finger protein